VFCDVISKWDSGTFTPHIITAHSHKHGFTTVLLIWKLLQEKSNVNSLWYTWVPRSFSLPLATRY